MGHRQLYEGHQKTHGLAHHPDILNTVQYSTVQSQLDITASTYPPHVHLNHGVGAADNEDQQVGNAEVEEEEVGGGSHGLGGEDHDEDQDVAHDSHGQDEAEQDEAGVGDVGGEDVGLLGVLEGDGNLALLTSERAE